MDNYYLPVIFLLTAMAALYYCKRQLKGGTALADERDHQLAGDAARYSISVYTVAGAIATFAFIFKYLSRKGK